ncbi:MAG: response regulator [Phycisphaerae bacterium]|jgi:DNA-binding response OmpR family regulator
MKKILIVDDESDILLTLGKRLTVAGYSVLTADNGHDAMSLAKSNHPDLIILDIVMPGMEGDEVAGKLKENPQTKNIPVIFLTAILSKSEEFGNNHMVADNIVFAKPFEAEELLAEIKTLLCGAATA